MLLNADEVTKFLETKGKGAKAQVGYDLTVKEIKRINGGAVMCEKTAIADYTDEYRTLFWNGRFVNQTHNIKLNLTEDIIRPIQFLMKGKNAQIK